jgi:prephenate dehydratase
MQPVHLLNMLRKEIKDKNNSDKITFYTLKALNWMHTFQEKISIIICLPSAPGALFSIFLN